MLFKVSFLEDFSSFKSFVMQFFGIFLAAVLAGFICFDAFVIIFNNKSLQIALIGLAYAGGDSLAPCKFLN